MGGIPGSASACATAAGNGNAPFLGWLRANHGHRFLGYLHHMEPHDP